MSQRPYASKLCIVRLTAENELMLSSCQIGVGVKRIRLCEYGSTSCVVLIHNETLPTLCHVLKGSHQLFLKERSVASVSQ